MKGYVDYMEYVGYCNECGQEYRGAAALTHGLCEECMKPIDLATGVHVDGTAAKVLAALRSFKGAGIATSEVASRAREKKPVVLDSLNKLRELGVVGWDDDCGWFPKAERSRLLQQRGKPMLRGDVRLHRNGEQYAISTNAETERDFLDGTASALAALDSSASELARWLPLIVDVAAKMRGYKADVIEKRLIIAGAWLPDDAAAVVSSAKVEEGAVVAP